jgi:hypothetical protein
MVEQINSSRYSQVLDALGREGFSFDSKEDLFYFFKTRLTIEKIHDKNKLYVDYQSDSRRFICSWSEKIDVSLEDGTIKITQG